jgi:hypothetical protein
VFAFDLGNDDIKKEAYNYLRSRYGEDRISVTWGDSTKTVPAAPPLNCDVFLVDGGHTLDIAAADLKNMKREKAFAC